MGSIYVPVDASVANNGIMTLDASGGGQTGGGYWINWTGNGYSNSGNWFWDDANNYLKTGWANAVAAGGGRVDGCDGDPNTPDHNHTAEYNSFLVHMNNGHSEDLNTILGDWDPDSKLTFVLSNASDLAGCVTSAA